LGAGGAARAIALALALAGAAELRVAVREAGRADDLLLAIEGMELDVEVVPFDEAGGRRADLVVNATPVGADGRSCPPLPPLARDVLVVDLL
jgi:shikimate dehydrogenase